jgi:glycosyltransferase involved in cell wall biosynthesis
LLYVKILDISGGHPVYDSMRRVLSLIRFPGHPRITSIDPDPSNSRIFTISQNNYLHYTPVPLKRENFYLMRSPLISLGTWEALLRGVPFCMIEEYHRRNNYKNFIARALLFPFRKHPVLSSTKQTCAFLGEFGMKSVLVPPALNKGEGSPAEKRKHVLCVGKLLPSKNPLLFAMLAREFPNEEFIMVGDGPLYPKMEEEAGKLGNLKLIKRVESRKGLFSLYADAKLLVHPAKQDPIGFVIIEALSTQTPALASKGAGASDFLPAQWVADPSDEGEWVAKTRGILSGLEESVRLAGETFANEHLDMGDEYFREIAQELSLSVKDRWPWLFEDR